MYCLLSRLLYTQYWELLSSGGILSSYQPVLGELEGSLVNTFYNQPPWSELCTHALQQTCFAV